MQRYRSAASRMGRGWRRSWLMVAALLVLAVGGVPPARGQCGVQRAEGIGGEVRAVARVHDTMLLAGFGSSVRLVNVADPAAPAFVFPPRFAQTSVELSSPAKKIAMTPGSSRAYVLREDGIVTVLSLGSSGLFGPFPNDIGVIGTLSGCVDVVADGTIVYAVRPAQIAVYQTSSGSISFRSTIEPLTDTYKFDRAVKTGLHLWVGFHEEESTIYGVGGYNMIDPDEPQHLSTALNNVSFDVSEAAVKAMTYVGSMLYIAYKNEVGDDRSDWVRAVDVSTPLSPIWHPGFSTGGQVLTMAGLGTRLHLACANQDLKIWNITDPFALSQIGSYFLQAGDVYDVAAVTGTDYLAGGPAGLHLVNTTNPASITVRSLVGWLPSTPTVIRTTGGNPATVAILDARWGYLRLFTTTSPGLQSNAVLPLSGAGLMELSVQPGGVYACITVGATLHVINISNPGNPTSVSTLALPAFPRLLSAHGARVYVFDQLSRLSVIDLSNPAFPVIRSTTNYGGASHNYTCMTAWSNRVALGTEAFGLWFIDTTNATSPLVSSIWNPHPSYRVNAVVNGQTRFYLNATVEEGLFTSSNRTEALDVSNIVNPQLTWRTDRQTGGDPGAVDGLTYVGTTTHKFLVGTSAWYENNFGDPDDLRGFLHVYDVTDQSVPVKIDSELLWGLRGRVASYAIGTRFFAAGEHAGVYDLVSPTEWAPAFIDRPRDATACFGDDLILDSRGPVGGPAAAVSASPPEVTYQWYRSGELLVDGPTPWGSIISGATTAVLTVHDPKPEDAINASGFSQRYACSAANTCGIGVTPGVYAAVCAADLECDGDTDVFDLLGYLDAWFPADAAADVDGQSGVDVFDLLLFLDWWFEGCVGGAPF